MYYIFIIVISYFIRSDGYPNLPFYSVLIANVTNIIVDFIFLKGFNMGIEGAALATVVGYAVGVAYISRYLLSKRRTFKFVSLTKLKIMEVLNSFKTIILNTPEVVGKIFFSTQMAVFTYLCSTYYGAAGLLAFLVYDNSETFVYIVLSGIMKAMSPIVAVFYKEMDFKAVQYIIKKSIKEAAQMARTTGMTQLAQCLGFDLTDTLTCDIKLLAHLLECVGVTVVKPIT